MNFIACLNCQSLGKCATTKNLTEEDIVKALKESDKEDFKSILKLVQNENKDDFCAVPWIRICELTLIEHKSRIKEVENAKDDLRKLFNKEKQLPMPGEYSPFFPRLR